MSLEVKKVKSHRTWREVEHDELLARHKMCNDEVDRMAKLAAQQHPACQRLVDACLLRGGMLAFVAKYSARCLVWLIDRRLDPWQHRIQDGLPPPLRVPPRARRPQRVWSFDERAQRYRCGVCWKTSAVADLREACAARTAPGFRPHRMVQAGRIAFCACCGAYSVVRVVHLAASCPGRPQSAAAGRRLARLCLGLHPVSGQPAGDPLPLLFDAPWLQVPL